MRRALPGNAYPLLSVKGVIAFPRTVFSLLTGTFTHEVLLPRGHPEKTLTRGDVHRDEQVGEIIAQGLN